MVYYTLVINTSYMDGNPFMNFILQNAVEIPAVYVGKVLGDRIGRRFTQSLAFFFASLTCIPIIYIAQNDEYSTLTTIFVIVIRFYVYITFFAINLQAMEIYPTCLRQTGFAVMSVVSNLMGLLGPYIVYLVGVYFFEVHAIQIVIKYKINCRAQRMTFDILI